MSISSANETDIPFTCALEPPSEQTDLNDSADACTWHFRVNIQITDQSAFDPMDFSHVLHQRNTKLHETMRNVSIISYSFLGIHQSSNSAAYDGFVHAGKQCATRLGTLKRWMTHSAIVGAVRWTQILKHQVYTKHPLIEKFLRRKGCAWTILSPVMAEIATPLSTGEAVRGSLRPRLRPPPRAPSGVAQCQRVRAH